MSRNTVDYFWNNLYEHVQVNKLYEVHEFLEIIKHAVSDAYAFVYLARQLPVGQGLLILDVSRSHTTTQHSR